jgi:hypothetical protein
MHMTRSGHSLHRRTPVLPCVLAVFLPLTAGAGTGSEWRFRVYLDDREIGYHHFTLEQDSNTRRLVTEARFDVTFLKLPVFRYRHSNEEIWNDRCLARISSSTDENGRQFRIEGSAGENGFLLSTRDGDRSLPDCVRTFAYWDRTFLESSRLLNAQTGEYLDVEVLDLGKQTIALRDSVQAAHHYRLHSAQATIDLWYSETGRWLALESTTDSGRVLRYVME